MIIPSSSPMTESAQRSIMVESSGERHVPVAETALAAHVLGDCGTADAKSPRHLGLRDALACHQAADHLGACRGNEFAHHGITDHDVADPFAHAGTATAAGRDR